LNLLGQWLNYPNIDHINNLKRYPQARFSVAAKAAFAKGERVQIEQLAPLRALTEAAIGVLENGATDSDLIAFIRKNYVLVLLTPVETLRLNQQNRSKMVPNRLRDAGIDMGEHTDVRG
jgi:hypothetical protein